MRRWRADPKNRERQRKVDRKRKRRLRREDADYSKRQREAKRKPETLKTRNALRRTPEARKKQAAYVREQRKCQEVNRKDRARWAVARAVKKGLLVPAESCQDCGRKPGLGSDGRRLIRADHHRGYGSAHYLHVRWICIACDGKTERRRSNTTRRKWTVPLDG